VCNILSNSSPEMQHDADYTTICQSHLLMRQDIKFSTEG
jgi:hypothetical protein